MNIIKSIGKELLSGKGVESGSGETYYITALRAEGIKNKDRFTKSDPYLTIQFGSKSVRTRTINNDLSPNWNETFTFNTSSGRTKDIKLKLKDDDVGLDDTIGTAVVSGGELPMYNGEEKYLQIPLTRKEEIHGVVHLKIKKVGGANAPSNNQQSTYTQSSNYAQPSNYPQHSNYPQSNYPPQQHHQQPPYQQPYSQFQAPQSQMYPQSNYQQPPPYQSNVPYGQQSNYPQQPNYPQQTHPYSNQNQNPQYPQPPYNQQYNQGYR